ncbi:S8/S53 family peptidase [Nonomuraea guangzhouensis]|uniref:S8/S53 family peptidase n=1 Tax=Nonomuraea guangzhouensis TaxID=1291555 RepID=A0ABW4GMN0_9ACTN|nr:S8/S53 family peptidase [Nonomuraea guangzhouensis]
MSTPRYGRDMRFWEQLEILNEALPEGRLAVAGPQGATPESDVLPRFAYLAEHLLVRAPDVERAIDRLQAALPSEQPVRVVWPPDQDARRVTVRRLSIGSRDVFRGLALLREAGIQSTLVHFVTVSGVNLCPGDEPVPSGEPLRPPIAGRDRGEDAHVTVIDTGLVHDYLDHQWLAQSSGQPNIPMVDGDVTTQAEEVDGDGFIKPYVGHGTFIAGVLRCVAPSTDVRVYNGFPYGGAVEEDQLGLLLLQTLDTHGWPDVLSLSAGTRTNDAQALLGLTDFIGELADHPETLLVAAAGNDGETEPFWPAAFAAEAVNATGDVILSVGALREDGLGRACFSNHGDWVTVFAPGERLINAYTSGDYEYDYPHSTTCRFHPVVPLYPGCTCVAPLSEGDVVKFSGIAQWSGTSFATPFIAGLIAARMSEAGVTSRQAAGDLISGQLAIPDLSSFLQ